MRAPSSAAALLLLLAACSPSQAQSALGEVTFANSGAAPAQEPFLRGLALLHSFEYENAARAFREAQRLDASFAMAYWGEAMTYNHPIWMQQDREAALAALRRLGDTPEARLARAPTEREKDYLRALHVLYGEGDKEARDFAYADAMAALHARYPDDPEAAAFYALALLGTSHRGRDIPTYMRAAAIADEVFRNNPRHPGAAHYVIHSFDDPVHAPLGLRAARAYSQIAPDAAHAQHMTSHIFVATGMWDDVVAANENAVRVATADRKAKGLSEYRCGHYDFWLEYGYLQQGRRMDSERLLNGCREAAAAEPSPAAVTHLVWMWSRYLLDTEEWTGRVASLRIDPGSQPGIQLLHEFTLAYGELHRGDRVDAARARLPRIRSLGESLRARQGGAPAMEAWSRVLEMEIQALLHLRDGDADRAVALLREATELEEGMPFDFGPPAVEKPSHELLGEVLLALDRPAEARRAFEAALARAPMRTSSLRGLMLAARGMGDDRKAQETEATLRRIWHRADPGTRVTLGGGR